MKIVVLAGGLSTERDVSITSGSKVAEALRSRGHRVVLLDVFMGYENELDDVETLFDQGFDFTKNIEIDRSLPDLSAVKAARADQSPSYFGAHVLDICRAADITFLALHGGEGENGSVQAALSLFGIRYTGTDYLGSAIAMHKGVTKGIFLNNNVPTPLSKLFKKDFSSDESFRSWDRFPCVVKPCSAGSSVGVKIVETKTDFIGAMREAFVYDDEVLVEEYVKGREFSVGVLGSKALPIIEIIPTEGFYDYVNKYQAGKTVEICPAELDETIAKKMQKEAQHAFDVLRLDAYARIDFLLDENGDFFCLEANTLPGMTPISLLPQEAKAAGISYPELCERIIELSLAAREKDLH